ncbi:hypothetical protein DES53_112178 [Roseimicrobium gellanilyticum]|uniref:Uncharacterized protein n=1 Tax=Roseimicrobium gellanilyticum TaxID=748857 RepID=A0A366H7Q1_9BACT|nr:hypothetical protein DES53_112178 [Roseimicrobium gellanilyticum]
MRRASCRQLRRSSSRKTRWVIPRRKHLPLAVFLCKSFGDRTGERVVCRAVRALIAVTRNFRLISLHWRSSQARWAWILRSDSCSVMVVMRNVNPQWLQQLAETAWQHQLQARPHTKDRFEYCHSNSRNRSGRCDYVTVKALNDFFAMLTGLNSSCPQALAEWGSLMERRRFLISSAQSTRLPRAPMRKKSASGMGTVRNNRFIGSV